MRLLYIARLFSGLEASIQAKRWAPTGAPAIYKLIERLDREQIELKIVLTKKSTGYSSWNCGIDQDVVLAGLKTEITVLSGTEAVHLPFEKLRSKVAEFRQVIRLLVIFFHYKPDIVYVDHANIWVAGILARISKRPIILRLLGVYPAMRLALSGYRIAHILLRWCYRAPFRAVVCTQDGSGIEPWLEKALSQKVPSYKLLNGVDVASSEELPPLISNLPSDRCVVLFLGKIEAAKGAVEFAEAMLAAMAKVPNRFHALVIGTGSCLKSIRTRVSEANAINEFSFVERLSHAEVAAALKRAAIYVSLNRLGNLSNANLEAMRAGCCMIFPASQPATSVDSVTDSLIPDGAVLRIRSAEDKTGLVKALIELSEHPATRKSMGQAIQRVANVLLPTWDVRVQTEMELIRSISSKPS